MSKTLINSMHQTYVGISHLKRAYFFVSRTAHSDIKLGLPYVHEIQCIFASKLNIYCFRTDEIIKESGNSNVVLMTLDLSSLKSVRQFAANVNKQESRLDVLVNNAGVANAFGKKTTEDGLELTMATNQYGPFLLTHLLLRKSMLTR